MNEFSIKIFLCPNLEYTPFYWHPAFEIIAYCDFLKLPKLPISSDNNLFAIALPSTSTLESDENLTEY